MNLNPLDEQTPAIDLNANRIEALIGHEVVDQNGAKIGTVESVWQDSSGEPAYLSVKTGWFGLGKHYILPAFSAQLNSTDSLIRVPYTEEVLRNAPVFEREEDFNIEGEQRLHTYYSGYGLAVPSSYSLPPLPTAAVEPVPPTEPSLVAQTGDANIVLKKENLVVGKREVEQGGLRLRKIVRAEQASTSVDLVREEPVVNRVPVNQVVKSELTDFEEQEIYIPLRREEAVIGKETVVTEQITAGKTSHLDRKDVTGTVRTEDLVVVDERENKS